MTTKEKILTAAIAEAKSAGLFRLTGHAAARRLGLSYSLVFYYFGTLDNLINEIVLHELNLKKKNNETLNLLAQALSMDCPAALAMPVAAKKKVVKFLLNK